MFKKPCRLICFITIIAILCVMIGGTNLPVALASNIDKISGFDKGPSYTSVVPIKRATFVNFDENGYLDDYAYLAAVPTSVFNDSCKLFSNPLLFYQDEYPVEEDKELSLNARQGIDYFMEDWMAYCNGQLDQITLINVPKSKLDASWKAKEYTLIQGTDPYTIASDLALNDWSYSDNAVIAVIDNFENYNEKTEGKIKGSFSINKEIRKLQFKVPQTNKLNPQFNEFTVPEGYVYLIGRAWYSCVYLGFPGITNISIPSGDKDLQLYCKYDGDWMQVVAASEWNANAGMDKEYARCYVYKPGQWLAGITDVPTKKIGHYGSFREIISNIIKGVTYKVDIEMYPGAVIPFDVSPPYYCRDIEFKFECKNSNVKFGFFLIGPSGEKILNDENGVIKLDKIGECSPGEHYQFAVYTEDDVSGSYDYEIKYSWAQNKTKAEGNSLTSATEGAVLASMINAPLLYTSSTRLSDETKNVLYKLGVEKIYLVNLGDRLSQKVVSEIEDIADVKENYIEYKDVYDSIKELSDSVDIVFSTIDSWSYWYASDLKPAGEKEGALFIGPAAFIAAHHGSPVLIVDNHPELSSAIVWHNEFWRGHSLGYVTPTVSEMYLTGKRVCRFFEKYGFKDTDKRAIITVADQYDIGASWDRMFVGRGSPGRFTFSPVDIPYWVSRSVFYPALIFVNPAMDPNGIELINGSKSIRGPFGRLKIIKPSGPENFKYPILQSYMPVYLHRFNERASKYWGFTYQCANGIIPGVTNTLEAIDDGVNRNEAGSFWPDVSESEDVPFYLDKGGYGNVFSTSFSPVMDNLNEGCIMWIVGSHGNSPNGGEINFHDPDSPLRSDKEPNPWRGYEWYLGSTEEPDTMTLEIHGIIPALLGNPNPKLPYVFRTALDWAPAKKPFLDKISIIANLPIIRYLAPSWLKDTQDYYDGIVGSSLISLGGTKIYNGYEIDAALKNIHSCGFITAACLPAYKYLHLAMIRHGSSFQIIDPWATSWYSSFWEATIPRDIVLGNTVGEAYVKGMSHVGILYISDPPQWWWDIGENVCYFGDPDLRVYVPGTDYSNANNWEQKDTMPLRYDAEVSVDGHMPFGATSYPNEREPMTFWQQYIWIIIALIVIVILVIVAFSLKKKKK